MRRFLARHRPCRSPLRSAVARRGRRSRESVRGDHALLLVEGETSYAKVKTEAQLVKEKGTWRLESETLQIRMGEE